MSGQSGDLEFAPSGHGPLTGVHIVEFAGIGPGPFACMLLADMGADIVRIDRLGAALPDPTDATFRGRRFTIGLDLKNSADVCAALSIMKLADIAIEGFRPGVMERLGLGPEVALSQNQRLVYARMTGWGQAGPWAQEAGHDINYIALAGALASIGPRGSKPVPPLNLIGDYGGGALYLVVGVLAALHEANRSGHGQVVDVAMCDGAASLMAPFLHALHTKTHIEERGTNMLDGGRHYYNTYQCADGRYVAVGAIEPQFYAALCHHANLNEIDFYPQDQEPNNAPKLIEKLQRIFVTKTRDEWCNIFAGKDACVSPVLTLSEAPLHPHNKARKTFIEVNGTYQPGPAPRFSRTMSVIGETKPSNFESIEDILSAWTST